MKAFIVLLLSCLTAMSQSYVLRIATNAPSNGDTIVWSGSAWVPSAPSGGGSGTVTNVGLSTSLSGLTVGNSPVTTGGTITLSGTLGLGSGGTGATDAPGARTALSLVPGTDVQAYDADLAAIAALANSGIIVRTGAGTVSARTITGDSEAVVSNGDGVSGNPTLSIGAAIARDSEVAAGYQPLDADLTAMAAGTAVATAQTNAVSFGAPVLYAGSTNIAQHLALKAPLASPAFTTSATIGGTNVLDYIASHLTEAEASALYQRTNAILTQLQGLTGGTAGQIVTATGAGTFALSNAPSGGGTWDGTPIASGTITNFTTLRINSRDYYNQDNGDFWAEGYNRGVSASAFSPHLTGAAVASGSISGVLTTTNNPMAWIFGSSTTTNSGYGYYSGHLSTLDIGGGSEKLTFLIAINNTNKIQGTWGFSDSLTQDEPVDGAYFRMDNGYVHGVIANNSSYSRTITSNQLAIAASTFKRYEVETSEDASYTTFRILSPSGTGYVTNWTDSVTNSLPTGSTRLTSIVAIAINRDAPSLINLITLDAVGKRTIRILPR